MGKKKLLKCPRLKKRRKGRRSYLKTTILMLIQILNDGYHGVKDKDIDAPERNVEKEKNSLEPKVPQLAKKKIMTTPRKLPLVRVPLQKALLLPNSQLHLLDLENLNPSQKTRKKVENTSSSTFEIHICLPFKKK